MEKEVTKLYRYERVSMCMIDEDGYNEELEPKVELKEFVVVRTTEHCYFIKKYNMTHLKEKRVMKDAKSTYAYDTKEKALKNFYERQRRALMFCKLNLKIAHRYLDKAKEMKTMEVV